VTKFKSPDNDQIQVQVIQAESKTLRSELAKIENYIWDKKELPQQTESVL